MSKRFKSVLIYLAIVFIMFRIGWVSGARYYRMKQLDKKEMIFTPIESNQKMFYIITKDSLIEVTDSDFRVRCAIDKKTKFLVKDMKIYNNEGVRINGD